MIRTEHELKELIRLSIQLGFFEDATYWTEQLYENYIKPRQQGLNV